MPGSLTVASAIVPGTKKIRGHSIPLPSWWLEDVNARFTELKARKEITLVSLARDLTSAVGRELGWDHRAVKRFLEGDTTTMEMVWAFLRLWPSLQPPFFVAHTRRDAERIVDVLRRGDSNPEWRNRYMEIDARLLEIAAPVLDQTEAVPSVNEAQDEPGAARSRRPRGVD